MVVTTEGLFEVAIPITKDFNENFRITPASYKTCGLPDSSIYFPKAEKNDNLM